MSAIFSQLPGLFLATGLSVLFLAVLFWPLEAAFPARPGQPWLRPRWFTDLCFLLGQYLVFGGLVFWLLTLFANWLDQFMPSAFRQAVAAQPWWAASD